MKKIISITFLIFILHFTINAQKIGYAPDFTITDTQGNTVNLYDNLDAGKTVLLFFFSVNCGHCHIEAPKVDSIWQQTGYGNNNVIVWGFECSTLQDVYNEDVEEFKANTGINFPCFSNYNQTPVHELFNVTYNPQVHIICPDKRTSEITFYTMLESIQECGNTEVNIKEISEEITYQINKNNIVVYNNSNETATIEIYTTAGQILSTKTISGMSQVEISINQNKFLLLRIIKNKYSFTKKISLL